VIVVAATNPSTIQNSSNTSDHLITKQAKSGDKQNLVRKAMRVIDNIDDRNDLVPFRRKELRKLDRMIF
jgi:hypothetical protein